MHTRTHTHTHTHTHTCIYIYIHIQTATTMGTDRPRSLSRPRTAVNQCVATCCSVLQRAAACCSVLQRVVACCSVLQRVAACCSVLQCVAACCRVLQCVVVCCIELQRVAACSNVHIKWPATDHVLPSPHLLGPAAPRYVCVNMKIYTCVCVCLYVTNRTLSSLRLLEPAALTMGWLRLVGSLKL